MSKGAIVRGFVTVDSAHISRIQAALELPSFGQGGDTVARSWRRSAADFKIDPAKRDEPQVLTDVALSIRLQERGALIEAARPEVDHRCGVECRADAVALQHHACLL
jgi:transcriptional regulator of acetoin/glycerol metabolism